MVCFKKYLMHDIDDSYNCKRHIRIKSSIIFKISDKIYQIIPASS